jgi:hypothetical protein
MSEHYWVRNFGDIDQSIVTEAAFPAKVTMVKVLKTMASFTRQVSIKSSLALDGGSVADVFTIAGGYIMIEGLIGFVTEAVSANACNMLWAFDPTIGASDTPICANVDINAMALGSCFYAEGDATAGVIVANGTDVGSMMTTPIIGPPGGIDMDLANSNPTTGIADVILVWRPLSAGAYVTVA